MQVCNLKISSFSCNKLHSHYFFSNFSKGLFSFFAVPILLGDVTLDFMSTIAVDVMVTASATGSGSGVTIMNTNTNMNTNNNGRKRRKRAEMLDSVINSCEYT